jgi:hypothetical protein
VLELLAGGGAPPKPLSTAFEGTPFLGYLQELEADLMRLGFDTLEHIRPEFDGAVRKLRELEKDREINQMISKNERAGLSDRFREREALRQQGAEPLSVGADTPSKGL